MRGFFDQHDRFIRDKGVGSWPARLNARYEAIIERNRSLFGGARVLDIASHDGRWSLAALRAGARHVTGIEVRPELVEQAEQHMAAYGVPNSDYRFICRDVIGADLGHGYDLVLCLGYFYHTMHHIELLEAIVATGTPTIIVDTAIALGEGPYIRLRAENSAAHSSGYSESGERQGRVLVGWPTREALTLMLSHYGYSVEYVDWPGLLDARGIVADPSIQKGPDNQLRDYANGERTTAVARQRTSSLHSL